MSDDLRTALDQRRGFLEERLKQLHTERENALGYIDRAPALLDQASQALAETERAFSLLSGVPVQLQASDVAAAEDSLGLRIGVMVLAPPKDANPYQLRLWAELMRTIYTLGMHQARLATDAADRLDGQTATPRPEQSSTTVDDPLGAFVPAPQPEGEG